MAVVKANYVKRGKGDKARAKATVRYIAHRRTRDNRKVTRELFGFDGALTKEQVYQMINEAPRGTIFYRFVISPDPRREDKYKDLSIEDITIDTMIKLEERLGRHIQFAATLHDDHTNDRHTHIVALVKGRRLTREDFRTLRQEATEKALFQRRMRDLTLTHQRQEYRHHQQLTKARAKDRNASVRMQGAVPGFIRRESESTYNTSLRPFASYTCPICSYTEALASSNRILASPKHCPYCGVKMKRDREISLSLDLTQRREAGYS